METTYVYRIYQYTVLSVIDFSDRYFRVKYMGGNIGKTWIMYKTFINSKKQYEIPPAKASLHISCHFKNINLKVDHHTWGKAPPGESVASPETLLLLIFSSVCKSDINTMIARILFFNGLYRYIKHYVRRRSIPYTNTDGIMEPTLQFSQLSTRHVSLFGINFAFQLTS